MGRHRLGIGHETMVPRQGHGAGAGLIAALQGRYAVVPSKVLAFEKAVAIVGLCRERPTSEISFQASTHHPEVMKMGVVVAKVEVAEEASVDIGHKTVGNDGVGEVVDKVEHLDAPLIALGVDKPVVISTEIRSHVAMGMVAIVSLQRVVPSW